MSFEDLKNKFEKDLSPKAQTNIKKFLIVFVVLFLGVIYYYASGRSESHIAKGDETKEVKLNAALLEEDIRESIKKEVEKTSSDAARASERVAELEGQTEELKSLIETLKSAPSNQDNNSVSNIGGSTPFGSGKVEYPPIANNYYPSNNNYQSNQSNVDAPLAAPQLIGGIGFSVGAKPLVEEKKTEKKRVIRLPPSFMKASLLVGIDAMTSQMGEANPEPIILRVQAPAVLPNQVKQNLEGCFIVADAFGNLAKERVQVRLTSLHCNSLDGKAVIDQKIEGFVADTDGKRDLAGIVVSKAGSNLARAFLASMVGGFGTALGSVGTTTISTATATTTNVDEKKVLLGAGAQGMGAGANGLAEIYTDLVKQATPTIEVGAAKKLMVIIQKPVELEIKTYD
jgi:conjugal transfer pilus assembly protein TraB